MAIFFDCLCRSSVAVTDDIEMVYSLCLLPALARKVECRMSNLEYQTNLTDVTGVRINIVYFISFMCFSDS